MMKETHRIYTEMIKTDIETLENEEAITELRACPIKTFIEMLGTATPTQLYTTADLYVRAANLPPEMRRSLAAELSSRYKENWDKHCEEAYKKADEAIKKAEAN